MMHAPHVIPERALWVAVVVNAIRDAQGARARAKKLSARGRVADQAAVLTGLENWLESRDGRQVCTLTGLTPGSRLTAALLCAAVADRPFGWGRDAAGRARAGRDQKGGVAVRG